MGRRAPSHRSLALLSEGNRRGLHRCRFELCHTVVPIRNANGCSLAGSRPARNLSGKMARRIFIVSWTVTLAGSALHCTNESSDNECPGILDEANRTLVEVSDDAIASDLSCSSDADCTSIAISVSCTSGCGNTHVVRRDSAASFTGRVQVVDQDLCGEFAELECGAPPLEPCTPRPFVAACNAGRCEAKYLE